MNAGLTRNCSTSLWFCVKTESRQADLQTELLRTIWTMDELQRHFSCVAARSSDVFAKVNMTLQDTEKA